MAIKLRCVWGIFSLIGAIGYARPISNHVVFVALLQEKPGICTSCVSIYNSY